MAQEPEEMLPEQGAAAAADMQGGAGNDQPGGEEEARAQEIVGQLQHAGGFQRREGQEQQKGGDELRPDEKGQAHPVQALDPQLYDGGDEIDGAQQRGVDEADHAENPKGLSIGTVQIAHRGQGRIGGPARLGRAAGNEKAGQHQNASQEIELVAGHVDPRKGHVRRADLERSDEIAEGAESQRHNGEEDHDGAMHRAVRIIQIRRDDPDAAALVGGGRADHIRPVDFEEKLANDGDGLAGMGDLPAHQKHQTKAEEHEEQRGDAVLHADDLVVGGKDVFPPKPRLFVMRRTGV